MASCRHHAFLLCAVLILAGPATWSKAEKEASLDDEATVETVEENLDDDYKTPSVDDPTKVYLAESFDDVTAFNKRWVKSEAKKQGVDEKIAKYDGKWEIQAPKRKIFNDDLGLVLTTEAKHAAISTLLDKPFLFMDKPLVVQYEVTMQEGQVCGGAYIKLLSEGTNTKADLRKFYDQTPYTIMFGPDKCGNDNKLHFIMRYQNPKNGSIEEKHSKKPSQRLDDIYKDKEPHLYTLIVRPDNTFYVYIDNKEVNRGSLLEDMTPPINPPEEIDDPNDKKPEDWDEREKIVDVSAQKPADWDEDAPAQIPDPNAVKPDGWLDDEPATIPDPDAKKPEDWDDEMDGEWEAPLIDNPACAAAPGCGAWQHPTIPNPNFKGKWRAPLIPNPNYRGKWTPRRIPNPHHFKDEHPFRMTPITAVGFELWSMSPQLLFDNLIVTEDPDVAAAWAEQTFILKKAKISRDSQTLWGRMLRAMNYKPAYWAVYGAYCAFPIICYIVYLIKRVREPNEDSVVERAFKFADENRWVYGVILVATFLFIGFVAYLVLGPKNVPEAEYKKTDMVTEDDPHDEEGEQQEPAQEAEAAAEKPGKASLEHAEEPVATETTPLVDTEAAGDGQRKRKPRKE